MRWLQFFRLFYEPDEHWKNQSVVAEKFSSHVEKRWVRIIINLTHWIILTSIYLFIIIYYYYLFSIYLINHVPNRILHKGKTLHTVKETIYKNLHRVFKNAFLHILAWCSSSLHYQWCRWYFSAWRLDEIQRALN